MKKHTASQILFEDIVDLERMQIILDGFAVGIVSQPDGKLVLKAGWKDICTKFHKKFPSSDLLCAQSNQELSQNLIQSCQKTVHECKNGFMEATTPIHIDGFHADIFIGQALFAPPDMDVFRETAIRHGYDIEGYLQSVREVPIVIRDHFEKALDFIVKIATDMGKQGMVGIHWL